MALDEVDAPGHVKIRVLGLISQHGLIDARMVHDERLAREAADDPHAEYLFDIGIILDGFEAATRSVT